jgi:hypothetical protein
MLIAPITLGPSAFTAAGSVVREDVPPGGLVVGVPARLIRIREPSRAHDSSDMQEPNAASGTSSAQQQLDENRQADEAAQAPPKQEQAPAGESPSRPGAVRTTHTGGQEGKELRLDG